MVVVAVDGRSNDKTGRRRVEAGDSYELVLFGGLGRLSRAIQRNEEQSPEYRLRSRGCEDAPPLLGRRCSAWSMLRNRRDRNDRDYARC